MAGVASNAPLRRPQQRPWPRAGDAGNAWTPAMVAMLTRYIEVVDDAGDAYFGEAQAMRTRCGHAPLVGACLVRRDAVDADDVSHDGNGA